MSTVPSGPPTSAEDLRLAEALRAGDEDAFAALLDRHHATMVRVASLFVRDPAVAEDVAQETWLAVLQGINGFEGRSSLKTWIFRILANRAKTRARRERRSVPFSALSDPASEPYEPAVAPERFLPPDHPKWPGHWAAFPQRWEELPEHAFLSQETRDRVRTAIEALPASQREVITLRDIEGWSADEVCNALGITETNQRVLLHRARSRVRRALEEYFAGERAIA